MMKRIFENFYVMKNNHIEHKKEYIRHYHRYNDEICKFHRSFRYIRPLLFIMSFVILSILYIEFELTRVGLFLIIVILGKEMVHQTILRKLDRSILKPISKIKDGVEEISKGNYDVKISVCDNNKECVKNELGLLIDSFNNMAEKLKESEEIKKVYENKRKKLIANISHDLKTPIASVQGYVEAIVDNKDIKRENLQRYLKIINKNTLYMNKLIDDLFLFSKLDMNKLEFNFEKICIKNYMNDLVEEFKFEASERDILFLYEDKISDNFLINIDRKRLHQSIKNIIDNAFKYGDKNNLKVEIILYTINEYVCIEIRDNGKGISEKSLPNIFDSFYRVDSQRTKDYESSGLGLSISKEIIEAHNGNIKVDSELNKGTSFIISIPNLVTE
jgi:signal transduction histidine kinase